MSTQTTINVATFEMAKFPIQNIRIFDGKESYIYEPKEDITNIELAHLIQLFTTLIGGALHHTNYDAFGFVEKHALQRHFKKVSML